MFHCSGCRVCNEVCPTGVRIAEINARARAKMVEEGAFGWRNRLRNNLVARPLALGDLGAPVSGLVNWLFTFGPTRWMSQTTAGTTRLSSTVRTRPSSSPGGRQVPAADGVNHNGHSLGLFCPTYSIRSARNHGIGDLTASYFERLREALAVADVAPAAIICSACSRVRMPPDALTPRRPSTVRAMRCTACTVAPSPRWWPGRSSVAPATSSASPG